MNFKLGFSNVLNTFNEPETKSSKQSLSAILILALKLLHDLTVFVYKTLVILY